MFVLRKTKREPGNVSVTIRLNEKNLKEIKKMGASLADICQNAIAAYVSKNENKNRVGYGTKRRNTKSIKNS